MVERAVLVAGVVVLACLAGYIVRRRARQHSHTLAGSALPAELAARLHPSPTGIVYFYGPHCATCRRQAGVLQGLSDVHNIPILHIDASRETQLADQFGVMTVPATVVVDRSRHVRSVNLGFRSVDALRAQLTSASGERDRSRAST